MARIRALKPDFFKDEDLATLPFEARLLYQGLWCFADKSGRLEDRPKYLKAEIFPYDKIDIEKYLNMLCEPKIQDRPDKVFIRRYTINNRNYIDIPEFLKHQSPHNTEKESLLPPFNGVLTVNKRLINNDTPDGGESYPISLSDLNKINDAFLQFWKAYPKRKAKKEADKAFKKLNPDNELLETIIKAINKSKTLEDWIKEKGKYIPYPATWLNGKRWEDEETEQHPLVGKVSDKTIKNIESFNEWRPPA
ncbi:MAG: hypothetical protein ABFD76_15265 [Smithella sp.]